MEEILTPKVKEVVEIFNEFFGEDKIDVQKPSELYEMLIYYPSVTVTNEYDQSIDISELYIKIRIASNGTLFGGFTMNRAEYDIMQYTKNYMHSHVKLIPKINHSNFQSACLGRGPIINTISTLNEKYNRDIWKLFCVELDKFVKTESVSGVPYHKLDSVYSVEDEELYLDSTVNNLNMLLSKYNLNEHLFIDGFIRYIIDKKALKFNYLCGAFSIAHSKFDILFIISNMFIDWYNQYIITGPSNSFKSQIQSKVETRSIVKECIIKDRKVFSLGNLDLKIFQNTVEVCIFKGNRINLKIKPVEGIINAHTELILNPDLVFAIARRITNIINYKYGRSDRNGKKTKYL